MGTGKKKGRVVATLAAHQQQDRERSSIDLDRVVWDPAYRKRIMIRLKQARSALTNKAPSAKHSNSKPN